MLSSQFDVVIVGAGAAGLSAAIGLARSDFRVLVLEASHFPGGSFEQLARGIRAKLWPLSAEAVVYPGHGPVTTIGHEKRTNPFVGDGA